MNILAIDAATDRFSVALGLEREARFETWLFEAAAEMRHCELAASSVEMLAKRAGIEPGDIGGVVCAGGPGSFTGLRIGFSAAKGIALALGIPFAPIPTLDFMARPFGAWPGIALPAIDAKKKAFFCAPYRMGRRLGPDMDAQPWEIAAMLAGLLGPGERALVFGPGAALLCQELQRLSPDGLKEALALGSGLRWGNAEALLEIARETGVFSQGRAAELSGNMLCGPEYLRQSDAEINLSRSGEGEGEAETLRP